MIEFRDILYGSVSVPDWLGPFIRLPEFLRLRGVRLSNVDSYQFKDFNGASRWEHGIAVACLAYRCAQARQLDERDTVHLTLAGLLHDVATPPFAHTAEYVLPDFDHEIQSQRLLAQIAGDDFQPGTPVFASQVPRFADVCHSLGRSLGLRLDVEEVAQLVVGEGTNGFLIRGTVDLDNADNVTRACRHLGLLVDASVPLAITDWLATRSTIPTDLADETLPAVVQWREYRHQLYDKFYRCTDEEHGRQAYLQHLMRRAIRAGMPRQALIWSTDADFLRALNDYTHDDDCFPTILSELVQRYLLLEAPFKLADIPIDSPETLRVLQIPQAVAWIEEQLASRGLEPMVMVAAHRAMPANSQSLFPAAMGSVQVYKLGSGIERDKLPEWLRREIPEKMKGCRLANKVTSILYDKVNGWSREKPWLRFNTTRKNNVINNLNRIGDWGFRLSRNDNIHSYPSTFVYAIPASLISSLGLKGQLIIDPFGGTGQTAVEAVKTGSPAISIDNCSVACLAAEARLNFLPKRVRDRFRRIEANDLETMVPAISPDGALIERWFSSKTIVELAKIKRFIDTRRDSMAQIFLKATFSAILPQCTGRRGKQHGFFADNTPLPKGLVRPPYCNAIDLFLNRLRQNLEVIERLYAFLERDNRDPEEELARVRVMRWDSTASAIGAAGIPANEVAGVITSPPYLCMADYTLGQRLTYYWLMPDRLNLDFECELGARRLRNRGEAALTSYLDGIGRFAENVQIWLRTGGVLATVIGEPVAQQYLDARVIDRVDEMFEAAGLHKIWCHWRKINWHRNHGYARLKQERIAVHVKE